MEFEYDPVKSASNLAKHGISFDEAQKIWKDSFHIEIPARISDEMRSLVIGNIEGIIWSAIITMREDSIRIISVRKARKMKYPCNYYPPTLQINHMGITSVSRVFP